MSTPAGWGPSHQRTGRGSRFGPWWFRVLAVGCLLAYFLWPTVAGGVVYIGGAVLIIAVVAGARRALGPGNTALAGTLLLRSDDPLATLWQYASRQGGGVYLGLAKDGAMRFARRERAVLLLGPPRAGKTSAVIVPALIAHHGPAVATSTMLDVARSTRAARGRLGRLWVFDPTGHGDSAGLQPLRWSPVGSAGSWDSALVTARAMTASVGEGTTHASHWATRAQALLAPLLHAAAVDGRGMEWVVDWVMRHELDEAGVILEQDRASRLAFASLVGILHTEAREQASIFSAAADALVAYTSDAGLAAARDPNFDAAAFVASHDTVYIHAPAEEQAAAAPLVCGLLSEIRRATYAAHRHGALRGQVLFALDEAANIAPIEELPAIASEGGGQGLTLLAAFQDLSQARKRWGAAADGFLTLFGTKLILTGIADTTTLESISVALGEYDRRMVARSTPAGGFITGVLGDQRTASPSTTVSTQRTRVLSAGEIANLPAGRALHLDGLQWELVALTLAHATEPWRTLTTAQASV